MGINIDIALNVLYQRQLTSREQLLREILRVKMTMKRLHSNPEIQNDKEQLFQIMKETTEDELGFFPADRDDFFDISEALKKIDLIDFALEIYKHDRTGIVISPMHLTHYFNDRISFLKPKKILITEAEKHLSGLREMIDQFKEAEFTLTTQHKPMYILLQLSFGDRRNVKIRFESIYKSCLENDKFDYIYALPDFGHKADDLTKTFLTKDSDSIAIENMLDHLDESGTLDVIVPAKITFATMGYEKLRNHIADNYHVDSIYILPEGTFRPVTSIKTYLLSISTKRKAQVEIGMFELSKQVVEVKDKKSIPIKEFLAHEDWRVELLLADDDEYIQKFKSSGIQKVKLKDVAEVFRGKSILKKDTALGNISILNISNIENGQIDYLNLDTIDEEERKVKRYELLTGDVVLSCRGTAVKSAVFTEQNRIIIASANLVVVRPKERVKGEFIKIFFESPVGLAIIKSFQRGTTIMNINYADIMEMEIPLLPFAEQQEIINHYQVELEMYQEAIKMAETRWSNIKESIYNQFM